MPAFETLRTNGFEVNFLGAAANRCPACGVRALKERDNDHLCRKDRTGCGKTFPLTDKRIKSQSRMLTYKVSRQTRDPEAEHIYCNFAVLQRLESLDSIALKTWFERQPDGKLFEELEPLPATPDTDAARAELAALGYRTDYDAGENLWRVEADYDPDNDLYLSYAELEAFARLEPGEMKLYFTGAGKWADYDLLGDKPKPAKPKAGRK